MERIQPRIDPVAPANFRGAAPTFAEEPAYQTGFAENVFLRPGAGPPRRSGVQIEALRVAVDVEAAAPDEADHGKTEPVGGLDGEAGGGRHGADDRNAGHGGLLHELEADPARQHQDTVRQRKVAGQERPADELVDGVVPADVLPDGQDLP